MANKNNRKPEVGKNQFRERGNKIQGRQRDTDAPPFRDQDNLKGKRARQGAEVANTGARMSRENPIGMYKKYDKFTTDAASLPFALPVGTIFTLGDDLYDVVGDDEENIKVVIPGVMRIRFYPVPGISRDFTSAMNRSSIRFYTYLRSNQKASGKYNHQDITMMTVALDSCYMFHGLCRKIYSQMNLFTPANEYYSRAIIAACGADFDDIQAHMQDFRAYINAYAYSLGQYAMPADYEFFNRHQWMVEGTYVDSDTLKAQTYLFVPSVFWKYDNTVTTGSQLTMLRYLPVGQSNPAYTFEQLRNIGDTLLNAVSGDEDFAVISGDIYNFYGGKTYKLPYVDENYAVLPTYDKTVLSQIENLTIVGELTDNTTISQNPEVNAGAIIFRPVVAHTNGRAMQYSPMNFHWDRPTPDDIIEASRLMATTEMELVEGGGTEYVKHCGTEIVAAVDIFSRNPSTGAFRFIELNTNVIELAATATADDVVNVVGRLLHLAQFDWAPGVRVYQLQPAGTTPKFVGFSWDIDNFDEIPENYLANIHLGVLLSLFKIGTNEE